MHNWFSPDNFFEGCAQHAKIARDKLKAKPEKKRAGRPEERLAAEVSRAVLRAYEILTGKRAGITTSALEEGYPRSGEFLDFLTEIFKALEIQASPDSQAKKVRAGRPVPWDPEDEFRRHQDDQLRKSLGIRSTRP